MLIRSLLRSLPQDEMVGVDQSVTESGRIVRKPQRLLFALLGELMEAGIDEPVRASVYLEVLGGAGVAGPTARASLDRLVVNQYLSRERIGRSIYYGLSTHGREIMHEAGIRVASSHPFSPDGTGWTLVTFTVPEAQRGARQQIRAALGWEGFASLRDGLWIAPGLVDLAEVMEPHGEQMSEQGMVAFHAQELPGFDVGAVIREVWDLDSLRASHELFHAEWSRGRDEWDAVPSSSLLTMLGADWTTLLRVDPRLPDAYMGAEWPARKSIEVYRARRAELLPDAHESLRQLVSTKG